MISTPWISWKFERNVLILQRKQLELWTMPELHSIDFEMIQRLSADLRREVESWAKDPWSWEDMVAQYQRLHTTQNQMG